MKKRWLGRMTVFVLSSLMTVSPVMNSYAQTEAQATEEAEDPGAAEEGEIGGNEESVESASEDEQEGGESVESASEDESEGSESVESASEDESEGGESVESASEDESEGGESVEPASEEESEGGESVESASEDKSEGGGSAESESGEAPEGEESAEPASEEQAVGEESPGAVSEEAPEEEESAEPVSEEKPDAEESEGSASEEEQERTEAVLSAPVSRMAMMTAAVPSSDGTAVQSSNETAGNESAVMSADTETQDPSAGENETLQPASTADKSFSLGEAEYSGEEDVTGSWNEESETGWKYLAENQSFVMSSYDGPDTVLTFRNAKNILAAGMNRLGSLISSSTVRLIGTGILQLDTLSLQNESDLEIVSDGVVHEKGGVAVFVKDTGKGDTVYVMHNGGVTGILDEVYSVPEGTDYVVPEGETLQIDTMAVLVDKDTGEVTYYSGIVPDRPDDMDHIEEHGSSGKLTVPENSSLTIGNGGKLLMPETASLIRHSCYLPELEAAGTLVVDGEIKGKGNIAVQSSGKVDGTGSAEVHQLSAASPEVIKGDILWSTRYLGEGHGGILLYGTGTADRLNLAEAQVVIHGTGITLDQINVEEDSDIIFRNSAVLNDIYVASGKELCLYSPEGYGSSALTASLTGSVSGGGTVVPGSGLYVLEKGSQTADGNFDLSSYVYIYNESGTLTAQEIIPFVQSGAQALALRGDRSSHEAFSIPVWTADLSILKSSYKQGGVTAAIDDHAFLEDLQVGWDEENSDYVSEGASISSRVRELAGGQFRSDCYVELISVTDSGEMTVTFYPEGEGLESADFRDVFLIRLCSVKRLPASDAGSAITSTVSAYTGSGRLGALASSAMAPKEKESGTDPAGTKTQDGTSASGDKGKASDEENGSGSGGKDQENNAAENGSQKNNNAAAEQQYSQTGSNEDKDSAGKISVSWNVSGMDPRYVRFEAAKRSPSGQNATDRYTLTFFNRGVSAAIPEGVRATVTIPFEVPAEWIAKWGENWKNYPLFAVFRDGQGKLRAFRISGGVQNGKLTFDTSMTGDFVIVCISDGETGAAPDTEPFYSALEKLDAVKTGLKPGGNEYPNGRI